MSGLKMFAPLHLGTFTDTLFYMHEHEHPSVLVQLHWCPSILREEALCSRLRCLPRALQLPKLDCAKHNWLVRSSLNVKSEGMPCRCTHIRICVFIIYIHVFIYAYKVVCAWYVQTCIYQSFVHVLGGTVCVFIRGTWIEKSIISDSCTVTFWPEGRSYILCADAPDPITWTVVQERSTPLLPLQPHLLRSMDVFAVFVGFEVPSWNRTCVCRES